MYKMQVHKRRITDNNLIVQIYVIKGRHVNIEGLIVIFNMWTTAVI